MKIIWLSQAQKSIDDIYDFFARKNHRAANIIYHKMMGEVEILSSFPELGKIETALSTDNMRSYRSLIILKGDYKVIYFIENNIVHISFIWVCRQHPDYLLAYIRKMEKEYNKPEEDNETGRVNDPEATYGAETEMAFLPPLTEEELANALTTEQVKEHLHDYIHKLFNQ